MFKKLIHSPKFPTMRYLLLLICSALLWLPAQSQLGVGTTGSLFIQNGTTFFVDSLVLIPRADVTMSNNNLAHDYTSITGPGGAVSITRVYTFSNPRPAFNGTVGIVYDDA